MISEKIRLAKAADYAALVTVDVILLQAYPTLTHSFISGSLLSFRPARLPIVALFVRKDSLITYIHLECGWSVVLHDDLGRDP